MAAIINKNSEQLSLNQKENFTTITKYNPKANTKHIIPVDLLKKDYNKIMDQALKAHKLFKCRGVTRSDFKFYNGKFYLLEINTQPGMTKLSLVPEIAAYKGINFIELIEWILKDASLQK